MQYSIFLKEKKKKKKKKKNGTKAKRTAKGITRIMIIPVKTSFSPEEHPSEFQRSCYSCFFVYSRESTHVDSYDSSSNLRLNATGETKEEKLTGKRSRRHFTKIFHGQRVTHDLRGVNH